MLSKLILPEIEELLNKKKFAAIRDVIQDIEVADIAEIISDMDESKQALFLRLLPKNLAADIFEYFDSEQQISLIEKMSHAEVASILNEMDPDDRTTLLEEVPAVIAKRLINLLNKDEKEVALTLLGYPEGSIGRLITTDFIDIQKEMKVSEVFEHIRKYGKNKETVNVIYVVDEKDRLIDDLKIKDLIFAEPDQRIEEIMDENFLSLNVWEDQEVAVEQFRKYDRFALPVTDYSGVLLGIVTIDDIMDIAEEEATEDIQKLGGTETLDEPYSEVSLMTMVKKRGIWLAVLFMGEMLTASAMAHFEYAIEKAVVLAIFVPLIISSGGNSGSQAATLVIRALALKEINIKDWFFVLRREFFSGLALGLILAVLGFARIYIWQKATGIYGDQWYLVSITLGLSLVGVVTWGTVIGGTFPLLLKKLRLDPATSSAPFVATLVDVVGIIIYFSIASYILKDILL